ncbi:neurexin-1 isoform X2 [Agrilus planipennis]|uniref:Neurexin-1 isoform X2 n=1 Tax=Agrilus planipennis TaxID=224129 RepID=A0A1W4W9B6_AGRPL|nr:neurexin-1 isoform X2 [Agrilus planipennis]XP_018320587.1 neurexin-1 isoform X2 [Agrilus planipennis]
MAWSVKLMLILVLFVLLPANLCVNQASFYGNSFISIPLKEAKGSTDIHFKFRTHLSNALIILVAGVTDYCIVRLDNTRLKININLGSGEYEVSSSSSKLNDFKWHKVHISRAEANLTLIVDNKFTTKHLPGKFFELNIHYGLFVGGHGNFSDLFFGHIGNFRGCLADIVYNGIGVLDFARHRQPQSIVQGITWNCAAEFDAHVNQPISFVEDKSFFVISQENFKNLKWQLELKTIAEYSIVMYNQGSLSKQDYFSMEIWKGKFKVTLKFGEKVTEVLNNEFIADGKWHKIFVQFLSSSVDVIVDSITKSIKMTKTHVVSLHDLFYIGGIEASKRGRAMAKGLKQSDIHFKGCMQHLKIGERMIGLKDAVITEGLLPSCVWQYPCLTWPCKNKEASCIQKGLDSYQCICKNLTCVSTDVSTSSKGTSAVDLEILTVKTLEVVEGQSGLITPNNLHLNLDYPKYGIADSGIVFHIFQFPEHGTIKINVWPEEKGSFTFHDLSKDKVHYVHDGSEHHMDSIVMDLQFNSKENFILPAHLQGNFKFTLTVHVQPKNDPPELNIPVSVTLRVAQLVR